MKEITDKDIMENLELVHRDDIDFSHAFLLCVPKDEYTGPIHPDARETTCVGVCGRTLIYRQRETEVVNKICLPCVNKMMNSN